MIQWKDGIIPPPPYISSIFNYFLSDQLDGYEEYDNLTIELAKQMPGFLGYESFKHDGRGSFISYWKDMDAVGAWVNHPIHREAKEKGKRLWYRYYHSMIGTVTHANMHVLEPGC